MFVAPKMLWNSCGKISAMSKSTACCIENRTNRGNCGFLDPVDKPIKTMKPPKGIAFSSATNGANGSNGSAISGKSLITYWPNGIASLIGSKYGKQARAFDASSTSSSVTGCFFFSDSSPLNRLKEGSEKPSSSSVFRFTGLGRSLTGFGGGGGFRRSSSSLAACASACNVSTSARSASAWRLSSSTSGSGSARTLTRCRRRVARQGLRGWRALAATASRSSRATILLSLSLAALPVGSNRELQFASSAHCAAHVSKSTRRPRLDHESL